jgi:hypothetical protein
MYVIVKCWTNESGPDAIMEICLALNRKAKKAIVAQFMEPAIGSKSNHWREGTIRRDGTEKEAWFLDEKNMMIFVIPRPVRNKVGIGSRVNQKLDPTGLTLDTHTSNLKKYLSVRARKALIRYGANTIRDMLGITPDDFLTIKNAGITTQNEIYNFLSHFPDFNDPRKV